MTDRFACVKVFFCFYIFPRYERKAHLVRKLTLCDSWNFSKILQNEKLCQGVVIAFYIKHERIVWFFIRKYLIIERTKVFWSKKWFGSSMSLVNLFYSKVYFIWFFLKHYQTSENNLKIIFQMFQMTNL